MKTLGRCAHIAALLFFLNDYISKNGWLVQEPSTSNPCTWNKGKKRLKDPKPVHLDTEYNSKKKRGDIELYSWDPRPTQYHGASKSQMNEFVSCLQRYAAENDTLPMWLTSFRFHYDDFFVDSCDAKIYETLVHSFKENISDEIRNIPNLLISGEIPNTQLQNDSDIWHKARWCRITASTAKQVTSFGDKMLKQEYSKQQFFSFCRNKLWFQQNVVTFDMLYGIKEEPNARKIYSEFKGNKIKESGIWVNKNYPWLGASPDGLIINEQNIVIGIIEIKCLKMLRERTVHELIDQYNSKKLKIGNQCFKIEDNKISLKKSHQYYYQVQQQLLVTGLGFCDFVLHSPVGQPFIERVFPDQEIQNNIKKNTLLFWENVLIPEYFLMKIPRNLLPHVFEFKI